tara:strand:+ start:84 stop:344 length:261 start_codon:yes stop_codon:yes gene_type:complete
VVVYALSWIAPWNDLLLSWFYLCFFENDFLVSSGPVENHRSHIGNITVFYTYSGVDRYPTNPEHINVIRECLLDIDGFRIWVIILE